MSSTSRTEYLLAAFIPSSERKKMEERAGDDPEAWKEISASDRLKTALDSASRLENRELDDALLALVAFGGHPDKEGWKKRIRDRIALDESAAARLTEIEHRLAELQEGGSATAHFERITGHSVDGPGGPRWIWVSAAAVVVLLIASGMTMRMMEDAVARAVWSQYPAPQITRGIGTATSDLVRVREMAVRARSSLLGLWPRYDQDLLRRAEDLLFGRDDPPALLERARIQLMRGEGGLARLTLERLEVSDPERARDLLELIASKTD